MKNNQSIERKKALEKMQHLCSEREKCRSDITEKLQRYSLNPGDIDWVLGRLEEDRFIDESRYAGFYARDKFRFNRWGRVKIRSALAMKKIDEKIIDEALSSIDNEQYLQALRESLQGKDKQLKEKDPWKRKARLFQFAASRGFEQDLIYDIVGELTRNAD